MTEPPRYVVKTRWVTQGAETLWEWGRGFPTLEQAVAYKHRAQTVVDGQWRLEAAVYLVAPVA